MSLCVWKIFDTPENCTIRGESYFYFSVIMECQYVYLADNALWFHWYVASKDKREIDLAEKFSIGKSRVVNFSSSPNEINQNLSKISPLLQFQSYILGNSFLRCDTFYSKSGVFCLLPRISRKTPHKIFASMHICIDMPGSNKVISWKIFDEVPMPRKPWILISDAVI